MTDQIGPAGPTIWLRSSNNTTISVEKAAAERSMLFKTLMEDLGDNHISKDNPIPVYNVNEEVLQKVMEWCDHHKNDPVSDGTDDKEVEISEWDKTFLNVDQEMLFEIILAANYLDIGVLLDVGCKTVANMIKGKSPDEMRRILNVHNDFTEEEEEQIRRENEWAEEE